MLGKPISLSKIQHVKIVPFDVEEFNNMPRQERKKVLSELPFNPKDRQLHHLYVCRFLYFKSSHLYNSKKLFLIVFLKVYLCDNSALTLGRRDDVNVSIDTDQLDENNKQLVVTTDLETCNWVNDKINSAIKYNRELKHIIDIF